MFRVHPIIDNYCSPPHVDGYYVLDEKGEEVGIFWTCDDDADAMLAKLNDEPAKRDYKFKLEKLSSKDHYWIIDAEDKHLLWGELFMNGFSAKRFLKKLNKVG